ncbi:hypothetical protein NE619_10405 [Anaerovorax odorimutans]|uniref:Uncharacterized protein n=1 Tax=Anaerovorax odorimutans TaxID=109327 RepID=A0ABT1RPM6_9FIRM|nr:hypothetical protein [Anaerovorax odorimutans]MCQ4637137.1 hypothetical protein [Anaerovorax odorimutans]
MTVKLTNAQILAELDAGLTQSEPDLPELPRGRLRRLKKHMNHYDDENCVPRCGKSDCRYSCCLGSMMICDYIGIVGHSRGCPAEGCMKYEEE